MRRYRIPNSMLVSEGEIRLTGDVLHHVRDVCRMHVQSKFEVLTEDGRGLLVQIVSENKHESVAAVLESRTLPPLLRPYIHLVLAVPRWQVFEAVLEKSVELGVHTVHPVLSDFSFVRDGGSAIFEGKRSRFEKIVIGATQQSGRSDLLHLPKPGKLDDFLQTFNQLTGVKGLFAYEGEGVTTAAEHLPLLKTSQPEAIYIFVGAEGGFSIREVDLFRSIGLSPLTLGDQVLRVETACVAIVSVIKYAFDLMR